MMKSMDPRSTKNMHSNIVKAFEYFKDEVSGDSSRSHLELYLPKEIPVKDEIPGPLEFYRSYIAPNIPVLIKGALRNSDSVKNWGEKYFCQKFGDKLISVAVTPNGYADAIAETILDGEKTEIFVLPEERLMTIREFYDKLNISANEESSSVFYIQKQNSNLTEEFPELLPEIDSDLLWASESFGSKPTAINLWIGDKKAVTSLHKDPFENIYCVVSGYKEFILLPPTDRPWLPYKILPVGQYKETSDGVFEINTFEADNWKFKVSDLEIPSSFNDIEQHNIPWIAIDPSSPDIKKYPLYKNASPLHVRVEQGDALYLPSLWFHYVKQSHKCVAINYWYDMNFDIKFAYFQLIDKLCKQCMVIS